MWNAPGGHVDAGQDVNEAALREVWEEVGLVVELVGPSGWTQQHSDFNQDLVPPLFVNRHRINDVHEHSAFVFAARASSRTIEPKSKEDAAANAECIWVTQIELDEMLQSDQRLRPDTYRYASAALEIVSH